MGGGLVSHMPSTAQPSVTFSPGMPLTNNNAGTLPIGTPVYSVAAGAFDQAIASSLVLSTVIGLLASASGPGTKTVVQTGGILTLTTAQWDAVAGTSGGLAFGTTYYLDPTTAGRPTATAPTATGKYVAAIGVALSTTDLAINLQPPIGPLV